MSTGPLPKQVNHRKLAVENRTLEGFIPILAFTRLGDLLVSTEGDVQVKVEFRSERKRKSLLVGEASSLVSLVCQHCLMPMKHELSVEYRHLIVAAEDALLELSDDDEGIVSLQEEVILVDLLEDELIVNLPMVSRHGFIVNEKGEKVSECEMAASYKNDETELKADTHRPFADLARSLKLEKD